MDYRARFYDNLLGRFISPDSMVPGGGSQAFNRYTYASNSPIVFNDPSGHKPCWATKKYTCHLTQDVVNNSYKNAKDKAATFAFFQSQGWQADTGASGQATTEDEVGQQAYSGGNGASFNPDSSRCDMYTGCPMYSGPGAIGASNGVGFNSPRSFLTYMLDHLAFGGETPPLTLLGGNPLYNAKLKLTLGGTIGNGDLVITPLDQGLANPAIWAQYGKTGITTGVLKNGPSEIRENFGIGIEGDNLQVNYDIESDYDFGHASIYYKLGGDVTIHPAGQIATVFGFVIAVINMIPQAVENLGPYVVP